MRRLFPFQNGDVQKKGCLISSVRPVASASLDAQASFFGTVPYLVNKNMVPQYIVRNQTLQRYPRAAGKQFFEGT